LTRLESQHAREVRSVNYTTCLESLASGYGSTYRSIAFEERLISKYISHSFKKGFWKNPFDGSYQRGRFLLQFDAIVETLRDGVPLAKAAERREIDFAKFHFSNLLFSKVSTVLSIKKLPDFSRIEAPGSLIESSWLQDVESLSEANFKDAKFYNITCDPIVRPGVNCYRADFSGADLRGADFRDSYLRGSFFKRALLEGADFRNSNIYECNFTGAKGQFVTGFVENSEWFVEPVKKHKAY